MAAQKTYKIQFAFCTTLTKFNRNFAKKHKNEEQMAKMREKVCFLKK